MSNTVQRAPSAAERIDPALWRMALAIVVGALAVVFDTTIVSVALHQLGTSLGASVGTIQWISTGYLLAMVVTIPVAGWAQQRLGGKRLWLLALTGFLAGSLLCAVAWDPASLIVFRVLQGLAGGVMLPLMATLIMQAAGGRNLGQLMAVVSLPAAAGPILGPALGGLILHVADWRWLFLVNVPFCVIGFVLAMRTLPRDGPTAGGRLDLLGLLLVSPGIAALVYGLTRATGPGGFGRADAWGPMLGGVALLVLFAWWELRRGEHALVDVRLLRHRPLAAASTLMALSGIALYGAMLLLPLYWQEVRGEDALGAGLLLIPQGIGTLATRTVAGRLTDRIGAREVALVGFAVVTLATIPFAFAGPHTNNWLLGLALFVRGAGMGGVMIPLMSLAYVGLERHDVPHASVMTRVAQQVGGSFGTAVLAVILQRAAGSGGLAGGFDVAFWWAVGLTAVAVVLALLLPRTTPATNANAKVSP